MYARDLSPPDRPFFLFGPRGTGEATWLQSVLPDAHRVDLLRDREFVRLLRDPGLFTREVEALRAGSWVVVDEVSRRSPRCSTKSRICSCAGAPATASPSPDRARASSGAAA